MYKYLLFDLDETLFDFKLAEKLAITEVLKKHSLPTDDETVALYSKINENCWKAYEKGQIQRDDIYINRFVTLVSELGVKNGQVFWCVRVAITGKESTPGGVMEVAELLGKEETLRRLDFSIDLLNK